ncbi:MAG: SidJ-related pseudokinase [Deltaproteobacteria bacterium]|jgi:hypothetical protein
MLQTAKTDRSLLDTYLAQLSDKAPANACGKANDFLAKYYTVFQLRMLTESQPEWIDACSIEAVTRLLESDVYAGRHQGFFLFRETAATLASFMVRACKTTVFDMAYAALKKTLASASGNKHRAVAGAIGELPLHIPGPNLPSHAISSAPKVEWNRFLQNNGFEITGTPVYIGRSLVASLAHQPRLLVCKMATKEDSVNDLEKEALWMNYLRGRCTSFPFRFDIPQAIAVDTGHVFRAIRFPKPGTAENRLNPEGYAISYLAEADYFAYPNESSAARRISFEVFREVMRRNAWLLGRLTAMGIVHTAVIPLFHNRTQRHRRRDHGVYEWIRGGRLDRWLDSCDYPNIGMTGIRDFEHFERLENVNQKLYRIIGNHFLSMLLVMGSYFRKKDILLMGATNQGRPVDARALFKAPELKSVVEGMFHQYYSGFVGRAFEDDLPLDVDVLVHRMIEEMGVDRHMEEILRVADQQEMTENGFREFLCERGMTVQEVERLQKGAKDIVLNSGPHLGGFNQTISLPELIEAVAAMSALCIAGKFEAQRNKTGFPSMGSNRSYPTDGRHFSNGQ